MVIKLLDPVFTVCKITNIHDADLLGDFTFLCKTDDEISLVCRTENVPGGATHTQGPFKMFKICGELDFSLVGIIAHISGILADAGISVFTVSTYNTDYVLVREQSAKKTAGLLAGGGYEII